MTGIEMLREYAKCRLSEYTCGQVPSMLSKECDDFGSCSECHMVVCNAIADQIEREIDEAVANEVADTLSAYEMNTNARWHSAIVEGAESDCKAEYELISRYWLPRPRFEDGEPVKVGDRFLNALGRECVVHSVVSSDAFGRRIEGIVYASNCDCHITVGEGERVKRPEPPDTWKRVEEDSKKFVCDYYGRKSMFDCREGKSDACPVSGTDDECDVRMAQDLVRRCKALAGVE